MRVSNERFSIWVMLTTFSVIALVILSVNAQSPPSNDMFATPAVINDSSGYLQGSNVEATLEPSEPSSCATCKTVWYRWTAPAKLSMTFELVMPTVTPDNYLSDTVMGVYMGNDVGSLSMLTWNDDISAGLGNHRSRVTFIANAGGVYNIRIYGSDGTQGLFLLQWEINGAESWKQFNFDGCSTFEGRKSDFGIYRPLDGFWWLNADFSPFRTLAWGLPDDIAVPGDYFGDSCNDVAIFRPSDGNWWILDMPSGYSTVAHWGMQGDVPVQGDFDGDDKADLAIYRGGEFWLLNSSDGSVRVDRLPSYADECYPWVCYVSPVTGDYDGDGKTDIGLGIQVGGAGWGYILIRNSSDGTYQTFDMSYDAAVNGDFDGDGKSDMAFYRNWGGNNINRFFYRRSSDGSLIEFQWGLYGDIPVSGDYGGSTGSDLCVWRPSDGNLYCYDPIGGTNWQFKWGVDGDKPIAAY